MDWNTTYQNLKKSISTERFAGEVKNFTSQRFSGVHELIFRIKNEMRHAEEEEMEELKELLRDLQREIPEPGQFSPSWEKIWDELNEEWSTKMKVYRNVDPHERDGEWQVIFNNPYSTEGVVCHTDLSFSEAAYLYAHFRRLSSRHEMIKLQKAFTVLREVGERRL